MTSAVGAIDLEALRRSLQRAGDPPLELHETHVSWVFVGREHAYKVKKPLVFDFADHRTLEARRRACEEEVKANQALAGRLGYELRALVPVGRGYTVTQPDHPSAEEWIVVSRRFDPADTMAERLAQGALPAGVAAEVGRRLAAFHAAARTVKDAPDPREVADRNFEGLAPLAHGVVAPRDIFAARRFTEAFLLGWEDVLAGRAATGRVVDGHGDLRAEHVLVLPDGDIAIVDRLDIPALRAVDVADDLAFLVMDLETLGASDVATEVLEGYAEAGGEPPPRELVAYFGAYRASVRAKVALIRAAQTTNGEAQRDEALRLLAVARRLAARARGDNVLLVTGPPASGKSTLAHALSAATGLPVLSTDLIRGEIGATTYDLETRARVYAELGRRASGERACIVDATFGEPALRRAFLADLDKDHRRRVLAVECHARPATLEARARTRTIETAFGSEADADVARRLSESFSPFDELMPADRLGVNAEDEPDRLVDAVEGWLDGHLASGRLG